MGEKCETGCMNFTGGEIKHHKDCIYYPESLSKSRDDFYDAVLEMRKWQKLYFKTRDKTVLQESIKAEKKIDKLILLGE